MTADDFELPANYRQNVAASGAASRGPYWTPERIALSSKYQYAVYQRANRLAHDRGARSILDVGCGPATKLAGMRGPLQMFGIDAPDAIAVALRTLPTGRFVSADLDSSSLDLAALVPDCSREIVICADVLEHLMHPDRLLLAIRAFSTKDTRIVLSTPERHCLLGKVALRPSVDDHVREWSFAEFRRFVERLGFTVLEQEVQLPFVFGIDRMTARYLVDRARRRLPLRTNQMVVCRIS